VALGGEATKDASAGFGMLLFWAGSNHLICMTAMPSAHSCTFLPRTIVYFVALILGMQGEISEKQ
jgi:hypothetical protein